MYTIIGFIALACLAGVAILLWDRIDKLRKEDPTSDDGCCDDHYKYGI